MAGLCRKDVNVIVSTYDEPEHLCLVLLALVRQTVMPSEVLIADDGSAGETLRALTDIATELPFRLVHVWQPDEGFRAARSRNNAIHRADSDIIAFLDQDTLPHRLWLERHLMYLRPGHLSTGCALNLPEHAISLLDRKYIERGEFETCHSASEYKRLDALQGKYNMYVMLRRIGFGIKGRPALASGNSCVYRHNLMSVNGFDEEYIGWGQEDDDLGWRLYLSGIQPMAVVNKALVSHITHRAGVSGDWENGPNIERYRKNRDYFRCKVGLDSHPHPDVRVTEIEASC